ncbi:hypothetical protein C8F04DRAFT_1227549 [Mycena alexandri]|uniref:Uncharacterized protein n=1 Tax=Mycena alexandri TaxID=1745969 RepID=A0AAD6XFM8_9AGAR|nr:hypothetical protein C8F04DRAFT_1227549 [Mycena alexandri]
MRSACFNIENFSLDMKGSQRYAYRASAGGRLSRPEGGRDDLTILFGEALAVGSTVKRRLQYLRPLARRNLEGEQLYGCSAEERDLVSLPNWDCLTYGHATSAQYPVVTPRGVIESTEVRDGCMELLAIVVPVKTVRCRSMSSSMLLNILYAARNNPDLTNYQFLSHVRFPASVAVAIAVLDLDFYTLEDYTKSGQKRDPCLWDIFIVLGACRGGNYGAWLIIIIATCAEDVYSIATVNLNPNQWTGVKR